MMLRRDELCPGGPRDCPDAATVQCNHCGRAYDPAIISMPSPCPQCGRLSYTRMQCDECREIKLDRGIAESGLGPLIARANEWDYMLSKPGFAITPDDIAADEFQLIRLIDHERARYSEEVRKRPIEQGQGGRGIQGAGKRR